MGLTDSENTKAGDKTMATKLFTLTNDFHGSSVSIRLPADGGSLSQRQTTRVYRELCGISDCTCGGIRGPQNQLPDGFKVREHVAIEGGETVDVLVVELDEWGY